MYVYFDKNGVVREIINDKAVRVGNVNSSTLYFFFDGIKPTDVFLTIEWGDLTKTKEISIIDNIVSKEIPYNSEKDYKFFKEYKKYDFYYYTIPEVASDGLAKATLRIMETEKDLYSQGMVVFNVENGVINVDHEITQSQYDYLVTLVARNNLEIDRIKYNAELVLPYEVETVYTPDIQGEDILKIHARPNFNVESMTKFIDDKDVENMFYGCGVERLSNDEALTSAGFKMLFNYEAIGKLQILINGNKYGDAFRLRCFVTTDKDGVITEEVADILDIPPMESGVFAFYRFNVYKQNVTEIKIVQEQGWFKDRFYIKSVEPFELTGEGYYEIRQKNGVVSKIDNPDTNFLYDVHQYVKSQVNYLKEQIQYIDGSVKEVQDDRDFVEEAYNYIQPAYNDIKAFEEELDIRQPKIEQDLTDATNTLTQINSQLDQPNGFASLGADGKIKASQLPIEKTLELFPISNENELTTLSNANAGDIAFITEEIQGEIVATSNYRLIREPYSVRSNWILQATTYSSMSAYSTRSGLADNSSAVNGIALKKIKYADYLKLTDKTGDYLVIME